MIIHPPRDFSHTTDAPTWQLERFGKSKAPDRSEHTDKKRKAKGFFAFFIRDTLPQYAAWDCATAIHLTQDRQQVSQLSGIQ
ncbi:MAG: hypothetical protein U0Z75_00915 [Deinococcaceae bacterium]